MNKKPKAIFIDWYKTLSNSVFWQDSKDHKKLEKFFWEENRGLLDDWMRGKYDFEKITKILSKKFDLDEKNIFDELVGSCKNLNFVSEKIPKIITKIRKKGIKVVIATDNMDTFRKFTIPALGLEKIFDDFLISYELEVLKRDDLNNFFKKYLKENNLDFSDIVLIDDFKYEKDLIKDLGLEIREVSQNNIISILEEFI